jgi:ATP-dependent RNA helicase DDX19/DBP5
LSPTFDLAKQTGSVIEKMKKFSPEIKMQYAIRGVKSGQNRGEKVTEHILVGTAGTVLDWVMKLRSFDPKLIKMFVLDDADIIIDTQGQQDQTIRIHRNLDERCQKVLFSATYSDEVMDFAKKIINNPTIITLKRAEESLSNIKQYYVWCVGDEGKFTSLSNLYAVLTIGQCIVFCRTRKIATWLAEKMAKEGHSVCLITGEATIEQRIHVLDRFREGKEKLMITTNLCARGIDIEKVTLVVNYDIPLDVTRKPDCETYLHRIGRTGRFGKSGLAINFVDGRNSFDNLMYIQKHFGREIVKLDASDPDEIGKLQES